MQCKNKFYRPLWCGQAKLWMIQPDQSICHHSSLTCTWSDTIRPCQNIHRNAPGDQILNFQNTFDRPWNEIRMKIQAEISYAHKGYACITGTCLCKKIYDIGTSFTPLLQRQVPVACIYNKYLTSTFNLKHILYGLFIGFNKNNYNKIQKFKQCIWDF
jgi:hypothetical protein